MSKYIPGNQKHLTLNDRIYIENELSKGTTFKDIAAFLCKDPTTISKEVKSRRLSDWYHKGTFYNAKNFCVHRYHCKKTNASYQHSTKPSPPKRYPSIFQTSHIPKTSFTLFPTLSRPIKIDIPCSVD